MAKEYQTYRIRCEDQTFLVQSPSARDLLTRRFWSEGRFYESTLLTWCRNNVPHGTWIDGGANLGNHSIFFAAMCPRCTKVISIEAVPKIYDYMIRNVRANLPDGVDWEPHNWALHQRSGLLGCWDPLNEENLGGTRLEFRDRLLADTMTGPKERTVMTQRLDDLVKADEPVTLIKLDIEGSEFEAILGAAATITRCHPIIIAEAKTKPELKRLDEVLCDPGIWGYTRSKTFKKNTHLWIKI